MVHRCCIPSCGMNVRVPEARGLSYHTFPVKEPQRHKWIAAIMPYMDKPKFKVVQGYTRICSRHFTKKDYSLDSKKRARLSSSAVPSVFPEKGAPLVIENINTISTDLSSADDVEKDLPAKILKCASDQEIGASNLSEPEITAESIKDEIADPTWQPVEVKHEFVEPRRRKIRKNRITKRKSTSPARDVRRKISTNSSNSIDELNIEHVGEAFENIKLSKLQPMGPPAATEPRFATPKDWKHDRTGNTFRSQQQLLGSSAGSVDSLCSSTDDNNSTTPVSSSLPLASDSFGSLESNIEPELLLSIQAVNLNPLKRENLSGGTRTASEPCTSSESESDRLPVSQDFEESLLETLTLNDFSLLDRFADNKLSFDMPSALLNTESFSTSILDDADYNVFSSPLQSPFDFDFTSEDILISEFQNMSAKSDGTDESTPVKKPKPAYQDFQDTTELTQKLGTSPSRAAEVTEPKSDTPDGRLSPEGNETKRRKTVRSSFSVERFLQSETDIEYYTGFSSYSRFETFFNQIQEFSTKVKVKQATQQVDNSSLTSSDSPAKSLSSLEASSLLFDAFDGISPSQGALSHMDELFLTIIRLRRKLPDKILGHMFCIARPAVTRTVRAWISLLTKILEKLNALDVEAEESRESTSVIEIPPFVQKLLESGHAKSILTNTRPAGLCRKTSCTPSCHSTSKSKRPKKEKSSTSQPAEHSTSGPTSPAGSQVIKAATTDAEVESAPGAPAEEGNTTHSPQKKDQDVRTQGAVDLDESTGKKKGSENAEESGPEQSEDQMKTPKLEQE